MLKFPVTGGTVTLRISKIILLESTMVSGPEVPQPVINQVVEENIQVAIHPEYPEQTIAIGSTLIEEGRKELCGLLRRNLDIFAWKPADMTGVPRHIAEHRINIREGSLPIKQKKRGQAPNISKAICEEVEKLLKDVCGFQGLKQSMPQRWLSVARNKLEDWSKLGSICGRSSHKSRTEQEVIRDMEETFKTHREIRMKLNLKKYAFGMREGAFMGYKMNDDGLKKSHCHSVDVTTTVVPGATSVPVHDLGVGRVNLSIFRDFASPTTTKVDVAGLSQPVGTDLSTGSFYISQDMDAETLRHVYISKWNIINDSVLDDPIGVARQACFSVEVRMRLEHKLRGRQKLEDRLLLAKCLTLPEYLSAMGEAIGHAIDTGMQDSLTAGIEHERSERSIADVNAFNTSAEGDYVAAINALRNVNFLFLAQLEANKDSSMADIMDLLHLEGPAVESFEASQIQPSPKPLMVLIHRLQEQVVIGGLHWLFP
nr:reverse transcriptase domain-containing protein [Tanacetum cinerariifolium]